MFCYYVLFFTVVCVQLCITRHAPEIQLKVSDLTVKLLWLHPKVKAVMAALGFHQIGPLLTFENVPSNR